MLGADDLGIDPIRAQFAEGRVGMFPAKCNWTVIDCPTIGPGDAEYKGIYLDRYGCILDRTLYDKADSKTKKAIEDAFIFLNSDKLRSKIYCGLFTEIKDFVDQAYYIHQLKRSIHVGSGKKPRNLFHPEGGVSEYYTAKDKNFSGSDFDYLTELTHKAGHHLYIRDNSIWGFPACYAIISEFFYMNMIQDDNYNSLKRYQMIQESTELSEQEELCYRSILPVIQSLSE